MTRAVRIGHASIDENGRVADGKAGNQTGRELCTRTWYNKKWDYVLRCKDSSKAEIMARACEELVKNPCIGYDQKQRNSLNSELLKIGYDIKRLNVPCETDCSAFMTVCAECAKISVPYASGNAPTTRTMEKAFMSTGMFEKLTDPSYLTTDASLKRGDILVKAGSHTVMVLEDGGKFPTLKMGSKGPDVRKLQARLNVKGYPVKIDGDFGKNTYMAVIAFQGEVEVTKDGIVGPITQAKLGL